MARCKICVAVELSTLAPTQYDWDMTGMAEFNGVGYLGDDEGFYSHTGDNDDGSPILSTFRLPTTDFGMLNQKRIRHLYLGAESEGELSVTVTADETLSVTKFFNPAERGYQVGSKVTVDREVKGRYFSVEISNLNGDDFGIDSVDALILKLSAVKTT